MTRPCAVRRLDNASLFPSDYRDHSWSFGEAFHALDDRNGKIMPKLLIILGVILIAVGIAWLIGEKLGLGRLPGDILIERGNFKIYVPIMTSIIISIVLTVVLWLINR